MKLNGQAITPGGGGLNCKVVGGSSQPVNPRENDLWVKTDSAIHAWSFSAEAPSPISLNRNLIPYPYLGKSSVQNGVTYTVNEDGSVDATGTASASAYLYLIKNLKLSPGTYKVTGCPSNGGAQRYRVILFFDSDTPARYDTGSGATFTITREEVVDVAVVIHVGAGQVTNLHFTPQLERGSVATPFVKGDATGHVWFKTGLASPVEFEMLGKNSMRVYPVACYQYENGAWVYRAAKTYRGGAWVDWVYYLYNVPDPCVSITGGWKSYGNGRLNEGTDYLGFRCSDSAASDRGGTALKIDLTPFKTIRGMACKTVDNTTEKIGVCTTINGAFAASASPTYSYGGTFSEFSLDVSKLTGEYYIILESGTSGSSYFLRVQQLWLEQGV